MSQQINLLNPLLKKQRDFLSLRNMLQALGFIIAGSLLFYGYAFYQANQLSKQFEVNNERYNTEQMRLANFAQQYSPESATESAQAEVLKLEKELDGQNELIGALKSSAAGSTGGVSEFMRAFSRQIVQGLWLTGFRVVGDGVEIGLSGAMLNPELLPVYIQRLAKEQVMRDKTFSTLQIHVGAGKGVDPGSPPRYLEFKLHSTSGSETKK